MSTFWQELFRLVGTALTPSTSYHPQMDGQIEIVNKWVEGYLRNYVAGQQKAWVRWLHLGEYCYNTTQHISIGMTHSGPYTAMIHSLLWKLLLVTAGHQWYKIGYSRAKTSSKS